jgi:Carboxypeptidase regulatory-like domain
VNTVRREPGKKPLARTIRSAVLGPASFAWLSLSVLLFGFPVPAGSQQPPAAPAAPSGPPEARGAAASTGPQASDPQSPAKISGTLVDQSGATVAGARVILTCGDRSPSQEVVSNDDGQFSFAGIAPGAFQLTINMPGFTTQTISGTLRPGEMQIVPQISLTVSVAVAEIHVVPTPVQVAEDEIKEEEKQRVLAFIPNFYVSYNPHALPLDAKQKFELAWKTTVDPVSFGLVGFTAGVQQAANNFSGYGQGAQGYGKRYGAAFADSATSTFLGNAVFASILKQDPRYFYKGTGSKRSRILYALANAVICKGDNGRWQANYSGIIGSLASGGISNLYYPASDRGAGLVFENTLIGIGEFAAANLFQEFVVRKLTPNRASRDPSKSDKGSH